MNAQQLKESVLQYAMQGKLVPQDPNDEPAIDLIGRIQEEKERLIKNKIIKKSKTLPMINDDEKPFDIPPSWEWTRLTEVIDVRDGTHDTPRYVAEGIPLITSKNLKKDYLDFDNVKYITQEDATKINLRSGVDNGDILFAMIGSIGNPLLVKKNREFAIKNMALFKPLNNSLIDMKYVYWFLEYEQHQMKRKSSGGVQSFVSLSFLRNYLIPLPPLSEQKRIVRKIEELTLKLQNYNLLHEESVNIKEVFPSKLENSILHYAIQGKLVEQDPNDEPAAELIERIRREKEILIKEKVLKKEKTLPPITDEEVPFDIPENWEWIRIKDITNFGNASTITPEKINAEDWVLDLEEIEKNTGRIIDKKLAKEKSVKSNKYRFSENEVLYGKLRPYLNKVAIAPEDGYCTTEIIPLKLYGNVDVRYVQLVLMSPYFIGYANSCSYGVKMPRLGTQQIANALIPLPPLKEQKRIVNRIESLFCITDKLK
ncbi:restriction endonuclease subunit S [Planococcus sp. A6]|uniref:restriction endonuclease subunit S n=1 Tax=Planococcus sp. A6 TaxID=2992760 RepID=UPI00237ABA0C|nr:restriction endonuclease subunit S [Planococcus sp. A6]MDE0582896.1 restriction endonuclease subunit S [Planococcus sp. A6]